MKKTKIYLIRHAETVGNIENRLTGMQDYSITRKGEQTIEFLNSELNNIKFDVAYCSKLKRTETTIEILAHKNKLNVIKLEELDEMYFGIYDGWKWENVDKINPSIKQNQKELNEIIGIEGQETSKEVALRMYNCILDICRKNEGKTVLICSHGVAIEAFLRYITNKKWNKSRERFCQHNTAINELEYTKNKFKILRLADTKYLEKYYKRNIERNYYENIINKSPSIGGFWKWGLHH